MKNFNEVRSYAGQVARAGAATVATVSYMNQGEKTINAGQFVVRADGGCKLASANTDQVLGIAVAMGMLHSFISGRNLSVLAANYGDEVWVLATNDSGFIEGDQVFVDVATSNAAKSGIATHFYVTQVNGNLVKIMRQDAALSTEEAGE